MSHHHPHSLTRRPATSRREFLKRGGQLVTASALAGVAIPHVHAAEDNTIRLALIGCGGRGSGAVADACEAEGGPVKLAVMADLFENRLTAAHNSLSKQYPERVDVPPERRFIGFDAYRKAIDCLKPGDVAMLTGYAAWRPLQLEYAVEKGVNVFMEKSFATDPPAARRIIKAGAAAEKKNLKIAAGLMCRHSKNRQELIKRIRDGGARRDPDGPCLPHGARRAATPATGRRKRPLLANPQLRSLPVGLGRPVGRNGHPPDRRNVLDQGCLPGVGTRRRRPGGQ